MQGRQLTDRQKDRILKSLAEGYSVTRSCKVAGIPRSTYYHLLATDPTWRPRVEEAIESGTDVLEDVAKRYAAAGDAKLITFLLGARRPHKYRATSVDLRAEDAARREIVERMARQAGLSDAEIAAAVKEAEVIVAEVQKT